MDRISRTRCRKHPRLGVICLVVGHLKGPRVALFGPYEGQLHECASRLESAIRISRRTRDTPVPRMSWQRLCISRFGGSDVLN
jgi:hypothetical protein